ncbi:putative rho family protein [Paratrimastix pyriformis]|uniref:Rho family protein n=1 Tax=Paratrimastix pyriformis TaxID=342808 RepID=A0ABQ8UEY7_9EUKA|nr:putative rho family protein [Paratrimastix pyriformis]
MKFWYRWHQIISTTTCWPVSLAHVPNSIFPADFEKQFQLFLKEPTQAGHSLPFPTIPHLKVVLVGEHGAGKTSLLIRVLRGFPTEYTPTVFDNTECQMEFYGQTCQLALWDTAGLIVDVTQGGDGVLPTIRPDLGASAFFLPVDSLDRCVWWVCHPGQEDYDRLRPLSYPGTDLALLCFSVASREQFDRVRTKFLPEVRKHTEGKPPAFLLVGCQADRRLDVGCSPQATVSYAECLRLVAAEGLAGYVETSALAGKCVDQLLQLALLTAIDPKCVRRFHERVRHPDTNRHLPSSIHDPPCHSCLPPMTLPSVLRPPTASSDHATPGLYATLAEIRTGTFAPTALPASPQDPQQQPPPAAAVTATVAVTTTAVTAAGAMTM